jgi:hypothetical protein
VPKTFEELMEEFRNPGDTGLREDFVTDLTETYTNDLSVREAAIAEREKEIAERDALIEKERGENTRLKAVNYDLLVAAPKSREPGVTEQPDDAPRGIDSLFE